jgi:hypothetical protein
MAQNFTWNQDDVNQKVHDASVGIRVVRPLLKLYGKQGAYARNIYGHRVINNGSNGSLTIENTQNLEPIVRRQSF